MMKIRYDEYGKRDIHDSTNKFSQRLKELKSKKWKHENNKEAVLKYINECLIGKTVSGGRYKKISQRWLYRVLGRLETLSEDWLNMDFDKASPENWEQFYSDMETDKIGKHNGKGKYSKSTKKKTYDTVKKFLKWKYGKDQEYPDFCKYWRSSEPIIEKEYITKEEVDNILLSLTKLKTKTLIMLMFDSGCRVEEIGNIRWTDLKKKDNGYLQLHLRAETTKTKRERYVTLFLTTELLEAYRNELKAHGEYKQSDYLFPHQYQNFLKIVKRAGQKVGKKLSPHSMRHSSATYYSSIIRTYQQFCARYGWKLNSDTAQRYFHSNDDDEVAGDVENNKASDLRVKLEQEALKRQQLQDQIDRMQKVLDSLELEKKIEA